jgi:arylsulfatase A-like enzyme
VGTFALSVFLVIPWSARINARAGANFSWPLSLAALALGAIFIEADHRLLAGLYPYTHIWLLCVGLATLDAAIAPWLTRASLTRIRPLADNSRFDFIATVVGCLAFVTILMGALHFAMISRKDDDPGLKADLLESATGADLVEIWANEPVNYDPPGTGLLEHPLLDYEKFHAGPHLENNFNILLISIDALRFDVLSPGSNKWTGYAPNMQALAAECANFTHTYAPGNRTAVGMGALMVGRFSANISWDLWIWYHGRMYNPRTTSKARLAKFGANHFFSTLAEIPPEGNLAQRLRNKGFTTMAMPFSSHAKFFVPGFGFAKGFDHYENLSEKNWKPPSSMKIIEQALKQQRKHTSGRWFQWIHLYDPHESKGNRKKYASLVKSTDTAIGALLAHLKRKRLTENTAIFIVADHGEALGGHRTKTHASTLYDDQTRVPMVACIPGQKPGIFTQPASTIDATATILALADADLSGIDGVNLLPAIEKGKYPENRPVFVDHHRYVSKDGSRTSDSKAVVLNNWKLIHNRKKGAIQLFDLSADPGEKKNLVKSKKHRPTTARLKELLDTFIHNGELVHPLP